MFSSRGRTTTGWSVWVPAQRGRGTGTCVTLTLIVGSYRKATDDMYVRSSEQSWQWPTLQRVGTQMNKRTSLTAKTHTVPRLFSHSVESVIKAKDLPNLKKAIKSTQLFIFLLFHLSLGQIKNHNMVLLWCDNEYLSLTCNDLCQIRSNGGEIRRGTALCFSTSFPLLSENNDAHAEKIRASLGRSLSFLSFTSSALGWGALSAGIRLSWMEEILREAVLIQPTISHKAQHLP